MLNNITFLPGKAWLSIPKFKGHLYKELGLDEKTTNDFHNAEHLKDTPHCKADNTKNCNEAKIYGEIVYKEHVEHEVFWKRVELQEPFIAHFKSIGEAASILKEMQRNWAMQPFKCIRRSELIKQKLPFISEKPKTFPYIIPTSPMGIFTLLDENTLFASAKTSSPLPLGQIYFEEDRTNPPSRAYLKLYESLSLMDYYKRIATKRGDSIYKKTKNEAGIALPKSVDNDTGIFDSNNKKPFSHLTCVDAGACPGGWTWVLDSIGANIIAIDRSPLATSLMNKSNIKFVEHDAFTLPPSYFGKIDWLFSDVVCYPPRLLEWLHKWIDSQLCENFICTIKMQGEPDMKSIREAASIPHSRIVYLTANKHELTFLKSPFL